MLRRDFLQQLTLASSGLLAAPLLAQSSSADPKVMLGIDVLAAEGFKRIQGQRIGLVTHPAGVNNRGVKTIDVLRRAPGVRLVKLFGPEHGIYGDAPADVPVHNVIDRRTGLPVFSLYGKTRKPTPEMLTGLDAMLVDLQDVGARSYTYISCMRYVLEACFEAGIKVYILDRPNPLGGLKVDGPGLDKQWMSYVGFFQVPYVYGLTIGEMALAATRNYSWLNLSEAGRRKGNLEVIPMRGWRRAMRWHDTGLRWIPTSPMIPDAFSAEGYAMTGLGCQLGGFTHGVRTLYPFRFLRFPKKSAQEIAAALRRFPLPGFAFNPLRLNDGTEGVYIAVKDWEALRPTALSFYMMHLACLWNRSNPFAAAKGNAYDLFNKHTGSEAFFDDLRKNGARTNIASWLARWNADAAQFQQWARQFWLYV